MTGQRVRRTTHAIEVAAPPGVVYGLLADVERWPLFFPPNVHVERLEFDGTDERLRMWEVAEGQIRSWISYRVHDPQERVIQFRQHHARASVESTNGTWIVEELPDGGARLTLLHDFTTTGDRPEDIARAERALDTESTAALAGLRSLAERWARLDRLVLSFEDTVRVQAPPEDVYEFLYRVSRWPGRLPHIARLHLTENAPGVQVVTADTRTADGAVHTTESVRICFPHAGRIVYKQTITPALLAAHTGEWSVLPDGNGVTVVSTHSVMLREEDIEDVLGAGADLERARRHVREALGRDSTATLRLAKDHAESLERLV
ncbi:aromatase/cyclase [Streptomyces sp. NPDC056730]|uniref:aromatase/cyclase n=1 Tax=unclassified Streptomyces TaxID=2593676 RepID=UPI0036CC1DBA